MEPVTTELPEPDEFYHAVLWWANEIGRKFSRPDVENAMIAYFNLTRAQRNRMTESGRMECYKDRTRRATTNLHGAGMLDWDGAADYEITNLGRKELAVSNGNFTTDYLRNLKKTGNMSTPEPRRRNSLSERDANFTAELPRSNEFYYAVLNWANQIGRKFSRPEVEKAMAAYFNLATAQRNQMTRGGKIERYIDRTRWATTHLHGAGMLDRVIGADYEITNFGRKELAASNGGFTNAYISSLKGKRQG